MTDPIADMLTRIRNASAVGKREVVMPMSKIKFSIAQILEKEGWVNGVEASKTQGNSKMSAACQELKIFLKYKKSGRSAIGRIRRVSRPGLRVYKDKKNLPVVLNNFGIAIISTPKGLMTNKEAKSKNLGGEVICEVY